MASRRQPPLPATPEAISAWAKATREQLSESFETIAKAMCEERNAGAPFEIPRTNIDALLRLWIAQGLPEPGNIERFFPKTAARIRGFVARERKRFAKSRGR